MDMMPMLDEKCTGAFVAAAVGDALGWPNEGRAKNAQKEKHLLNSFQDWKRYVGGRYWSHTEKIAAGEYSDDTQMILAVSRSLLSGQSWDNYFVTRELPFWLEYERGGGGAMLRAAKSWKSKIEPWHGKDARKYFEAGGNGAAMRVLPHVIFHIRELNFQPVAEEVVIDAMQTHGHPRAIVGALCYAYALYYLLQKQKTLYFGELIDAVRMAKLEWGQFPTVFTEEWLNAANSYQKELDYKLLWLNTVDMMIQALETTATAVANGMLDIELQTLTDLGCFDKKVNGAGDVAAVAAIYLASKYANNPMLGIKSAANAFGSDTDTIASMTGGLLGALCGAMWLPAEWKFVQDFDCLVRLAGFLLSQNGVEEVKEYTTGNQKKVANWERSPIGVYRKLESTQVKAGKTGVATIEKYITVLGQTLYIRKYSRQQEIEFVPESSKPRQAQSYSFFIEPFEVVGLIKDSDMSVISFSAILRILELFNCGITNADVIAEKVGLSTKIVEKIMRLIREKGNI